MEKKNYNFAIDGIRVGAILAVIAIHTTTKVLEVGKYALTQLPLTFFLHEAASFAVPLFFLMSGFLLELNYSEKLDYKHYIKKRVSRVFFPYLFWSLFYFLVYPQTQIPGMPFLSILISGTASYQLYFIPSIIIFYILFPALHTWYAFLSKKQIIVPIVVIELFLLARDYYIKPFHMETSLRISLLYFAIFLLGMIASHHKTRIITFINTYIVGIALVAASLVFSIIWESSHYYFNTHNLDSFYSQHRPLVFVFTLVVACVFYYIFEKLERYKKQIMLLSKLSFFVFFVHVAIMYVFWFSFGSSLFDATRTSAITIILYDLLFMSFVAGVSFGIAYVVHKIPKLNILTG